MHCDKVLKLSDAVQKLPHQVRVCVWGGGQVFGSVIYWGVRNSAMGAVAEYKTVQKLPHQIWGGGILEIEE
jgi:hypothetical protein